MVTCSNTADSYLEIFNNLIFLTVRANYSMICEDNNISKLRCFSLFYVVEFNSSQLLKSEFFISDPGLARGGHGDSGLLP